MMFCSVSSWLNTTCHKNQLGATTAWDPECLWRLFLTAPCSSNTD